MKDFVFVPVVAGVVVYQDGKFLLVQEKQPKVYGQWNLPGGRVDVGETIEQAAVREAKEEAGFDVNLGAEVLVMHQSIDRPVLHSFEATITGGELKYDPEEILDAKWFTYEEILNMKDKLRNQEYILKSIEKVINEDD